MNKLFLFLSILSIAMLPCVVFIGPAGSGDYIVDENGRIY